MSADNVTLRWALWYAKKLRWRVLPCRGKIPLTAHGVKDASTDPAIITQWWSKCPDANVGIACGDGLFVIDIDTRHGGDDSLADLEHVRGKLPRTVESKTGGGGRHIFLRAPDGVELPNSVGKLGPGIDTRHTYGYVIAPPSIHASGRHYEWEASRQPDEVSVAPMPDWLIALLRVENSDKVLGKPASEWQQLATESVPEGQRNDRLARVAGHLLRRFVEPHLVLELVTSWNATHCKPPLPERELTAVIESIASRELRRRSGR